MEERQSVEIKALFAQAQDFCEYAKKFRAKGQFTSLGLPDRKKLDVTLNQTLVEAQRLLQLIKVHCSYCRRTGGKLQGECTQCGEEVCTLCGVEINGKFVHRDICARFFHE